MYNTIFALDKIKKFVHEIDRPNINLVEQLIHTKTYINFSAENLLYRNWG